MNLSTKYIRPSHGNSLIFLSVAGKLRYFCDSYCNIFREDAW